MGNDGSRPSPLSRGKSRKHSKPTNSGHQYIAEDEVDSGNRINNDIILQTPKPTMKRMDKIRRSLSFRKKKKSDESRKKLQSQTSNDIQTSSQASSAIPTSISVPADISTKPKDNAPIINSQNVSTTNSTTLTSKSDATSAAALKPSTVVKPPTWVEDEKKVRAGNCSFQVKYLGTMEVSDSRGMHLCESAIEKLLVEKDRIKKPIKAILYVSGDSLRVVDESNKTLLVDQTIEKVSFCAPDRHHENGFAYICRDGTTRRWLCYCFMAIKDTLKGTSSTGGSTSSGGERLSHAVGCAFSVCLEKKQRREKENVSMEVGPNHSFSRFGSFRQASLTERLEDPQMVMPAANPVPIRQVDNPHAIERPKANPDAFTRQNSLRGTGTLQLPFKRGAAGYTSLKPGELPSFQQQKANSGLNIINNSNFNNSTITKTSLLQQKSLNNNSNNINYNNMNGNVNPSHSHISSVSEQTQNKINTISELPEDSPTTTNAQIISNSTNTPTTQTQINFQNSEWPNLNNVFPTPQSMVSPRPSNNETLSSNTTNNHIQTSPVTPPPLPPMPPQYTTPPTNIQQQQKQAMFAQHNNHVNSTISSLPLQQQFNMMSLTPNQMAQMSYGGGNPSYTSTTSGVSNYQMQSPIGLNAPNPNETFEQKWARIQAAKNTNPFAEDIAKKFEIKLT